VIMILLGVGGVASLLCALVFSVDFAVLGMLVVAAANSLAKIGLDAVIQRDVAETLRSSAFARSETFLQLAWVLGAAIGCLLPADDGGLGFWVAGGVGTGVAVFLLLRTRAMTRNTSPGRWPEAPGSVAQGPSAPY